MALLDDLLISAGREKGVMRHAKPLWRRLNELRLPVFRPLASFLYAERQSRSIWLPLLLKFVYREPLLRYRCESVGRRLQLEGAIPEIGGDGRIAIGDNVRIGPQCSWYVGHKVSVGAELRIGNDVGVGYRNFMSVVKSIEIGDRTMLASGVAIFDNPSHPMSPRQRFFHEPFELDDAAPVVIGRNCWIGSNAFVLKGVTIGDNSIVAAASVVTKPVPPNVLVGGAPAKILRELPHDLFEADWEEVANSRAGR
ncbi:MAG TPA: acyltransferase [Gemmatimonadaceae bacterium]|nr:acyltransferase [Gemmatimonadaceae bacterium]